MNIDGVEALAIYISVLMLIWRLDSDASAINAADYTRKSSTLIKGVLEFSNFCICNHVINSLCFAIKAFDTFVTTRETVDLSTPAVSPITCRKLPLA